jgi:hypothetical protein
MSRMPRLLTSTRTGESTNKTSITSAYRLQEGLPQHRRRPRLQRQPRRLHLQLPRRLLLRPERHRDHVQLLILVRRRGDPGSRTRPEEERAKGEKRRYGEGFSLRPSSVICDSSIGHGKGGGLETAELRISNCELPELIRSLSDSPCFVHAGNQGRQFCYQISAQNSRQSCGPG